MAFTLEQWANLAAIVSAMVDVLTIGKESFQRYLNLRMEDPALPELAVVLDAADSTFSDQELDAIKRRIEACRDRFVREGSGEQRKECLCSVLKDVKDGNGGDIPVPDWADAYRQLRCA